MAEQAFVTIKEAAAILGASEKRIRRLVKSGELRAELAPAKYGQTYRIERAALPSSLPPGQTPAPAAPGITRTAELLADLLRDTQGRFEGAMVRLGQLEGEREHRLELEARARSLVEAEATERVRAEGLARDIAALEGRLRWRTWAAGFLLAAFAVMVAAALLR